MPYEIDFIGVDKEGKKDADAIAFRWEDASGNYIRGIYDGGLQDHGEELEKLIKNYYFESDDEQVIDCVICSHSDLDHASGLANILEKFTVKSLYMNRPWVYIDEIWDHVDDGRITKKSLEKRLKDRYQHISNLEHLAQEKGIPIFEAFQGTRIEDDLLILSPSKDFYLDLLIKSDKTPLIESSRSDLFTEAIHKAFQHIKSLIESWTEEKLRENVSTSAENEMSVILLGEMEEENFLLTGDAGIRALDKAIVYSDRIGKSIKDTVKLLQIPHHGGRHNVSPSILDRLIGKIVKEDTTIDKAAVVSVAKDSNHPLQMVVNAFIRRGVTVYKTASKTISNQKNMPKRKGWAKPQHLGFNKKVEDWDD